MSTQNFMSYGDAETIFTDVQAKKFSTGNVSTVQSTLTASKAYNQNDPFIYNGQLYKADSAIAQGETITIGTNASATTIEELINLHISGKTDLTNIATVESTTTASRTYASGEHLILNGQYYRVTSAILTGGTIVTSGTGQNVTPTTVDKFPAMGSSTKGIYVAGDGTLRTMSYSVSKDVPSDAKFTDTLQTILNGSGSAMNQRSKLQFIGGNVKDDSTNDKTVFTVARELTQAEYDVLSSEEKNNGTTYYITDAPSSYTGVPQSMIGDAWVLNHNYAVGDYAIDANGLYKNGTAHTSTATNRPSVNQSGYWTAVTVAGELSKQWVELGTIYGTNDGAPSGKNKSINIPSNAKRIAYAVGTGWYEFPVNISNLKFAVYRPYASSVVKPRYLYFTTQTTGTIYNIYDENGTNIGTSDEAKNLVTKVYVQY